MVRGGFTGGVYEIGALRALDLLSVNRTVNEFDVYVGTSAGSLIAAAVANGVTPEEMMRVIVQQVPTPFPDIKVDSLLRPNYGEFLSKGLMLPWRLLRLVHTLVRDYGQISAVDIVDGLAHPIPACRIVAVTLPPTLDSAFIVSLIAATGAPWSPVTVVRVRQRLQA